MRRQHLQKLHISRLESIGPIIVAMLAKNFKTRLESIEIVAFFFFGPDLSL